MEVLMLEGWTPILLISLVVALIIFLISRKTSRIALFLMAIVLSFICLAIVIYSREFVGGWDGIGLLFVTISGFVGLWVGTVSGLLFRK